MTNQHNLQKNMNYFYNIGRYLFALTFVVFGIQHFIYADFVSTIVPGWIPFHLFWVYVVGIAFIMAPISIVINKLARLACIMLGATIFLFVALIHIPLILENIHDGGKIANMFKDVGLGSCAFILASTFPKKG